MKKVILAVLALTSLIIGTQVLAAANPSAGIGGIAAQVTSNLGNLAKLITAISYVSGLAFAVAAIAKFKSYKENPTQMPLSTPVVFFCIAIALAFLPSLFKAGGSTFFSSGTPGSVYGWTKFSSK